MKAKPNQREGKSKQPRRPPLVGPAPVLRSSGRSDAITFDITKRKREDEECRRSAQLYSRLVNSLDCIVWEADAKTFQFSFVSPQAECMLGYPVHEWLMPGFWAKHVHPEDLEWCTKFCVDATAHGREHEFEYRMIAADGRIVWLHDVVSVSMSPEGPKQLIGVMIDVTRRKLAETALKKSEERFRTIFENAGLGAAMVDLQGHPIKCNPALQKMLGFTEDELCNMVFTEFTHPDDVDLDWKHFGELIAGTRESYEIEKRYIKKDGQLMCGQLTVSLVKNKDGTPGDYVVGMVEDITERKRAQELLRESEERFRAIFENVGVATSLVDRHGRPFKCNPAVQKILGFAEEELCNMPFTEFTHPDDVARDWKLYEELLAGKLDKYEIDKRYFTKDGRLIWGHLTVSLVKNKDGSPADYTVGMLEDITERKQADQKLREAHDQLIRELAERTRAEAEIVRLGERLINTQEEERTRIAGELHDNLSQQIAALGIALSHIKRQIPAARREAREQAGRAYDRLLAIGEGIRHLSHELHPALLEQAGLVAALESYCAEFESLNKVRVTILAEKEFSEVPMNVQLGLYRIAQEALHNVWKHSGEKEGLILLTRVGQRVHMKISDQGLGFDQGQSAKEAGLGLVSMRERAKLLGGEFRVETVAGNGTAIIVDIPLNSASLNLTAKSWPVRRRTHVSAQAAERTR